MSGQGVAALYGVVTFAVLAVAFMLAVNVAFGWPLVPTTNRVHGTFLLAWYALAGVYARAVGAHGARGATLEQAWRAALGDLGRGVAGLFRR